MSRSIFDRLDEALQAARAQGWMADEFVLRAGVFESMLTAFRPDAFPRLNSVTHHDRHGPKQLWLYNGVPVIPAVQMATDGLLMATDSNGTIQRVNLPLEREQLANVAPDSLSKSDVRLPRSRK